MRCSPRRLMRPKNERNTTDMLSHATATLRLMEKPSPDPTKLLNHWMEWERGETTPGDVMKNLKVGGVRELLEALVASGESAS